MKNATGGKEPGLWSRISIALLAGSLLILLDTFIVPAFASAEGAPPGARRLEQVISDHFSGSDSDLSAPDVAAYVNSYGVPGAPTYGPEAVFNPGGTEYVSAAALTAGKFVVAYHDNDVLYYGMAVIGDVSGKVMTYGSETHLGTIGGDDISAAALSSAKFVAAYSAGNTGTAIISEVSGNVIAYGSAAVYNTGYTFDKSAAAMSEGKFVITYRDFDNSNFGTAIIGDVSGNVIT